MKPLYAGVMQVGAQDRAIGVAKLTEKAVALSDRAINLAPDPQKRLQAFGGLPDTRVIIGEGSRRGIGDGMGVRVDAAGLAQIMQSLKQPTGVRTMLYSCFGGLAGSPSAAQCLAARYAVFNRAGVIAGDATMRPESHRLPDDKTAYVLAHTYVSDMVVSEADPADVPDGGWWEFLPDGTQRPIRIAGLGKGRAAHMWEVRHSTDQLRDSSGLRVGAPIVFPLSTEQVDKWTSRGPASVAISGPLVLPREPHEASFSLRTYATPEIIQTLTTRRGQSYLNRAVPIRDGEIYQGNVAVAEPDHHWQHERLVSVVERGRSVPVRTPSIFSIGQ